MRVIVYTIMKNEKHNIDAFLENIKDADGIYILDTGSTDGSYEYINSEEIKSKYPQLVVDLKTYDNFDFATARNDNLAMVPEEDCICWTIDLDERFCNGWYEKTLEAWRSHPNFYKLNYWYAPSHKPDGSVTTKCTYDKCHRRIGAYWRLPIHEVLEYTNPSMYNGGYVDLCLDEVFVHHYQKESTNRDQYIKLIKQRIDENPYDIEAMNHLTTEYYKANDLQAARDTQLLAYSRGLTCGCEWLECIAGNIAGNLANDGDKCFDDVCMWYERAIKFNPQLRTYYIRYALYLCYGSNNHDPDKAAIIMKNMEQANTSIQESYKEIPGAWTWLPLDTWGVIRSWQSDYIQALIDFEKAYEAATDEDNTGSILTDISAHITFARGKLGLNSGGVSNEEFEQLLELVHSKVLQNDLVSAEFYYKQLLNMGQDVYGPLAYICYLAGNYRDALTYGGIAHKMHPDDQDLDANLMMYKSKMLENQKGDKDREIITYIESYIKTHNFQTPITILDVGTEAGKWCKLFKERDHDYVIDGIEVYTPYIEQYNLMSIYNCIYNEDMRTYIHENHKSYDIVILAEVLEHVSKEDARDVLNYFEKNSKIIAIMLPYQYQQDAIYDNQYQAHIQDDLTPELVSKLYPELKLLWKDSYHGYYIWEALK